MVAAAVCRLSEAVTGVVPETVAVVDEQTGDETAPLGDAVSAHVSATEPVKPPAGVRVIVEVALAPGLEIAAGVAEIVSVGMTATFTVICVVVEAAILPVAVSTPFTVSV